MTLFVPGKLTNPLNGSWGGWRKHATQAKRWRDRTALAVYQACAGRRTPADLWPPERRKVVTFDVQTWNHWDDDALPAACKPLRDELIKVGLIHSDASTSGHRFLYRQTMQRAHRGQQRGVTITVVPLLEDSPAPRESAESEGSGKRRDR
jgi:hypothetical protein